MKRLLLVLACREATGTHAAYLECLEARGTWVLETDEAAARAGLDVW
ncbi:MAG: hypothetical protein VCC00_01815 [Deltaproteobacteria bacterium]